MYGKNIEIDTDGLDLLEEYFKYAKIKDFSSNLLFSIGKTNYCNHLTYDVAEINNLEDISAFGDYILRITGEKFVTNSKPIYFAFRGAYYNKSKSPYYDVVLFQQCSTGVVFLLDITDKLPADLLFSKLPENDMFNVAFNFSKYFVNYFLKFNYKRYIYKKRKRSKWSKVKPWFIQGF